MLDLFRNASVYPARYELLDGLRGVAALVVVFNHLEIVDGQTGHLAVMMFFIISGYCITASADSCLRSGIGFKEFMLRRARRIYPPYLFAILFFAATRVIKTSLGGEDTLPRSLVVWVQNLTMAQWLTDLFHPVVQAAENRSLLVPAFWSLNYEEQFYLVMALGIVLASGRRFALPGVVLLLAGIALAWNWFAPGDRVYGFFIEYWVHFAMGASLYWLLARHAGSRLRAVFVLTVLMIGVACCVSLARHGIEGSGASLRAITELCFICPATLVLFFLRPWSSQIAETWVWRPFAALGLISYSLYLIHSFNVHLVKAAAQRIVPASGERWFDTLIELALLIGLSAVFWWVCERPFVRHKTSVERGRTSPAEHASA